MGRTLMVEHVGGQIEGDLAIAGRQGLILDSQGPGPCILLELGAKDRGDGVRLGSAHAITAEWQSG